MPFIYINVNNTFQEIIRPEQERITLISSNNGFVEFHNLKNNASIKKGELVKYQVSAFNYNQWGMAQGSINEYQ